MSVKSPVWKRFVHNKNVLLVGPAGYLQGNNQGHVFDKYDLIVRLNQSRAFCNDYGSRTDIMYCFATEMDEDYYNNPDNFTQDKLQFINITHAVPPWDKKIRKSLQHTNIYINGPDEKFYQQVWSKCGTKPNTGTVAIAHLLASPIKSLTVTGIDLFETPHYEGYKSRGIGAHDFDKQVYYLSHLYRYWNPKKRFNIDDQLRSRIHRTCLMTDTMRTKLPKFSLVIPYKADGSIRDDIFKFNIERYKKVFPEAEICVSNMDDCRFSRAVAINRAARQATNDIFCIVDADALFSREFMKTALKAFNGWVTLSGRSWRLSRCSTLNLINSEIPLKQVPVNDIIELDNIKFFMLISKDRFFGTNGFDEAFTAWGGEDFAFFKAQEILYGPADIVPAYIFHLWHPAAPNKKEHMFAFKNKKRGITATYDRHYAYAKAKTKEDIYKLLKEDHHE